MTTISDLCGLLEAGGISHCRVGDASIGQAVVIAAGARILALSPAGSERNVFWTHPSLGKCRSAEDIVRIGIGGPGGIRLWQSPEARYQWKGPAEPATFRNYEVQAAMDPGNFTLGEVSANRCVLTGDIALKDCRSGEQLRFGVRRIVEIAPVSVGLGTETVLGVALRMQNHLILREGSVGTTVDLWHLMQLPAGTIIGAHLHREVRPTIYFNPENADGWTVSNREFRWCTNGKRQSKIGLPSDAVASELFAIREGGCREHYLWRIPLFREGIYVDSAPGTESDDQAVQFWDGFDFCEVEYHSPGVTLERPEVHDASELIYFESR